MTSPTPDPALLAVVEARSRDLGGFVVRRVLPAPHHRNVGPFVFLDHMGPVTFPPGHGIDVRPHPHIHLATVTYLFEGEIVHRDSLGFHQSIRPGAINWMTAGKGIVHSERASDEGRANGASLHGLQLWVALPLEHEDADPSFVHYPADDIPEIELPSARARVLVGSAFGATSPVKSLASLVYVDLALERSAEIAVPDGVDERALYVVEGEIEHAGTTYAAGTLVIFAPGARATVRAESNARTAFLGGAKLDAPRTIEWNFVSSSPERIAQAKDDWKNGRFPKVPGDDKEFIPLPE